MTTKTKRHDRGLSREAVFGRIAAKLSFSTGTGSHYAKLGEVLLQMSVLNASGLRKVEVELDNNLRIMGG